ncbi:MAG: NTP transferase domain-containing protein [Steroidobacteraceae bacterium]
MKRSSDSAGIYGLVLAGGRSKRMQRDKAALLYQGTRQLERAMEILSPFVDRAFVSVRQDQEDDPLRARYPRIVDTGTVTGPIAGIMAAQAAHPDVAWLVLACDLPFLDPRTLEHLRRSRRPDRQATAYRSSHDGLPEPLCAIYEPASREAIAAYVAGGRDCPRKFLRQADVELLDQPDPRALDNANTPEEYGSALAKLDGTANPRRIEVQYFALLREQAGRSTETVTTVARTPRELYAELRKRHPFSLAPDMLRVAVNAEFGEWSQPLGEGDAVVFIPPVAGG